MTDLSSDAKLALAEKSGYEKLCVENGTQLNLIKYLSDYLNKPENANTTLPVNVGLDDEALTSLIAQYNALILERNRLRRASSDSNPVVRRLDSNIDDMHASLLTTINSDTRDCSSLKPTSTARQANMPVKSAMLLHRNAALSASSASRKSRRGFT